MGRYLLFLLLVPFTIIQSARANDSAFGGSGSTPMPIKTADVVMVDEHIVISGNDIESRNYYGSWSVTCDYTFKNTSDKKIDLTMGFPFPVKDEMSEVTAPKGINPGMGDPLVHDFKVWVKGKEVPAKRKKISANEAKGLYYKDAYLWDMTFAPGETIGIRHKYTTGVTAQAGGYIWASYVLKTGGMWKGGTIGRSRLEVIPNTATRPCAAIDKNGGDYLTPKPAGKKEEGSTNSRKYTWDLMNFQPTEDLDLCLMTGYDYVRFNILHHLMYSPEELLEELGKKDKSQLRTLRNTVFAQYGRIFEDKKLQEYFEKQWWYTPNSTYSDSMLTAEDKALVATISKIEKTR